MKSILIDTSNGFMSFSITEKNTLIGTYNAMVGKRMSEVLLPTLENFLQSINFKLTDLDNFYVVTGPGSFTGLRISIATILGITTGLNKKLQGITSLDAAALCSGKDKLSVACKLRLKEYAVRDYDFINDTYSDYYYITENDLNSNTLVINGKTPTALTLNLTLAIINKNFKFFLRDYLPFYMQKSEAEIQFDKKSKV